MSDTKKEKEEVYKVLARKYRPTNFDELIGQEALVRTLKNAIDSKRVAHAFMLTGIRGTGKTTTARIIAKALNYTGADGKQEATTGPTDDCPVCQAITQDRHQDVIEMDAASRTGVDDIREIIDGVRYAPTEARYKIYIIDEVHMLSKNAFNALLKTLEEPPEHVKFIFATTEIRKVPITILSRCQRFDLRRVGIDDLAGHYKNICDQEDVQSEDEALNMISRAADGSVRDGLSLLDQAIALSSVDGKSNITADLVRSMLGLSDRTKLLDLFSYSIKGETETALDIATHFYENGQDPALLIQDLTDMCHVLTKIKAVPKARRTTAPNMTDDEYKRATELAQTLSIPALNKAWQLLLKGMGEVHMAGNPQSAAEMLIIRLCYASNLPDPVDMLKNLANGTVTISGTASSGSNGGGGASGASIARATSPTVASVSGVTQATQVQPTVAQENAPVANANLETLEDVVTLLETHGEMIIAGQVGQFMQLITMKAGHIEFVPVEGAPRDLSGQLSKALLKYTEKRWVVTVGRGNGQPTLQEQAATYKKAEYEAVLAHEQVQNVIKIFPTAEITKIETK
ncbi:MAG: DNA polymerase III subunit gamma/tau [Alphaproteobacteria bacterium]|nr:DNA polymerase III subunit gamma/tau [Alphaproteobacteria bacterium]